LTTQKTLDFQLASKENSENVKDRSLGLFHGEAAVSSIETAGEAYQSPTLVSAGAGDKDVALLSTLSSLFLSFVLVKVPSMISTGGSIKRLVVLFSVLSTLTWIPLILVLFFFNSIAPYWLILLWIVSLVPSLLTGPLRDDWLAEKVPSGKMGRYLSVRSAISAVVYITAFFTMGYVLDHSGVQIFRGYAVVVFVAFCASLSSIFLFRVIKAPKSDKQATGRVYFGFKDFLKETKRGNLGKFVAYVSLLTFAVNLCSAFFTVYMLRDLHFSYMDYAIVISSEYLARIVSLSFWGRLVDRTGSIRVFGIISRFIPLIPILWIFSGSVPYLVVVQLISGTVWAAFDLCNQTLIYRSALPDLRLRFIVYNKALTTFSIAVGAITGALLLNFVWPVFGNAILGLFLISGVIRLIIVLSLFPRLKRNSADIETVKSDEEDENLGRRASPDKLTPIEAQYFQGGSAPAAAKSRFDTVLPPEGLPVKGVFYHPEDWAASSPAALNTVKTEYQVEKIVPPKTGIYYRPEEWGQYYDEYIIRIPRRAIYSSDVSRLGLNRSFGPVKQITRRPPMMAS
jgi:hypothetical protein